MLFLFFDRIVPHENIVISKFLHRLFVSRAEKCIFNFKKLTISRSRNILSSFEHDKSQNILTRRESKKNLSQFLYLCANR